ncbi:PA2169 family four-helix-bundle protein [Chitinophaga sp. GCM10012297]|uniref:PA2169 family four-helix-bundle protein n=1 Tax=Chitinophaga chungangae TaxID=2821488 RepID=A0ABS3YGG8_9BACT|nr:PA2169 family four-helix-bundle protein [Chitinophaga chungangae]MBO9153783.1 PA2169 family four-helix-bundle protein [Chitinophaga chungangae]
MKEQTATTGVLNDLIAIHNDRIAGYQKALKELKAEDSDLERLFTGMISESQDIRETLAAEVRAAGGDVESGTTASGKIYRAWMDVKAAFSGNDRKAVLSNCEAGEDAAQNAYKSALKEDGLPSYLREVLTSQMQSLRASHDEVKALRDAA